MGNAACTIGIKTESNIYAPGSTVKGRVYLNVNNPNGVNANALNVRCFGAEETVVHYTTDRYENLGNERNRVEQIDHFDRNSSTLFHIDVSIASFNGGRIYTGQYEYPFQFVLPETLPSSMICHSHDQSKCEIKYEISAYAKKIDGGYFGNWMNTKSAKKILQVVGGYQYDTSSLGPIVLPPETRSIKSCCNHKGFMTLSAEIENPIILPHTRVEVGYQCKNESTIPVKQVKVMIKEKISWRGRHRHREKKENLASNSVPGQSLPELQRLLFAPRRHRDISASEPLQKRKVSFFIPHNALQTYNGDLIQVQHLLMLKLETACCVTSPEACIFVTILGKGAKNPLSDVQHPSASYSYQMNQNAPPSEVINNSDEYNNISNTTSSQLPEAVALPLDWNPQLAEEVTIPIAEATVIGYDSPYQNATAPTKSDSV